MLQIENDPSVLFSQLVGTKEISILLNITPAGVCNLFKRGVFAPCVRVSSVWLTTRAAVVSYMINRVERRGNPLFGTVYKGRPKQDR
jgi:hypothetical protein